MSKDSKSFPVIPVKHWYNLRSQFKKSIPGSISSNYLASTLGMSEGSARSNITPTLRMIGLVDENDKTNQDKAKMFRDDGRYKAYCQELLKENYPQEVLDAFPDSTSDRDKVQTWFMNHTGVGLSAARRVVAFYYALLEADIDMKSTKSSSKAKPQTPKKEKKVSPKPVIKQPEPSRNLNASPETNPSRLPDLNLNIQVHISSDATPDQIEKIFEAMSKHLYRNR